MSVSDPSDLPKARIALPPGGEEKASEVSQDPLTLPPLSNWTPAASDHEYRREPRPTASVWHVSEYARTEQ